MQVSGHMKPFKMSDLVLKNQLSRKRTSQTGGLSTEKAYNFCFSKRVDTILVSNIKEFNNKLINDRKKEFEKDIIIYSYRLKKLKKIRLAKKLEQKRELEKAYLLGRRIVSENKNRDINFYSRRSSLEQQHTL